MNKRQRKKLQKRIDFSLEYGFWHTATYKEIKELLRGYHECCEIKQRKRRKKK